MRKLLLIETGGPPPGIRAARGSYGTLIHESMEDATDASVSMLDVRTEVDALPDPSEVAAAVISGSSHSVTERAPWMTVTEAWLRRARAIQLPVYGICFGHQLLAQAFGGDVQKNPKGREVGTVPCRIRDGASDPILEGVPQSFTANATHGDTVVSLPPDTEVFADSEMDRHQILKFYDLCYGVQFHPEFDRQFLTAYFVERRERLLGEGVDVDAAARAADDAPHARRTLHNFLRMLPSSIKQP